MSRKVRISVIAMLCAEFWSSGCDSPQNASQNLKDPQEKYWAPLVNDMDAFLQVHSKIVNRVESLGGEIKVGGTSPESFWLLIRFSEASEVSDVDLQGLVTGVKVKLFLENSRITDSGVEGLDSAENIRFLSLRKTSISDNAMKSVGKMSNLEGLSLEQTAVTNSGLVALSDLHFLTTLRLSRCDIDSSSMDSIVGIRDLRELWLDDTMVSDSGMEILSALQNLELLSLNGTKITDECVDEIAKFKRLKFLYVERTGISANGISQLRNTVMNCKIVE